jgi:integrase
LRSSSTTSRSADARPEIHRSAKRHARSCLEPKGGRCNCTPSWEAAVYINGGRQTGTFPSKREAQAWQAELKNDAAKGRVRKRPSLTPTLHEATKDFLVGARDGTIESRSSLPYKPATIRGYEGCMRDYVLPALACKRLGEIRRRDVQMLANSWKREASPSTIRNRLDPLRTIFRLAVEDDVVFINPVERVKVSKARGKRDRIASPEEAAKLLAALPVEDRAVWATAMYAGLRRGELRALRWSDVDLEHTRIRVERSWDDEEGEQAPKSEAGTRTVPMLAVLAPLLREHKLRTGGGGTDLVFGAEPDRAFMPSTVGNRALKSWEAAKLNPIGLHECRHTLASLLIAAGENPKIVQKLMGHASIGMTMDTYAKLFEDAEDTALTRADAFLAQQTAGRPALRAV